MTRAYMDSMQAHADEGGKLDEVQRLKLALAGLVGLTELVHSRDDVPQSVKDVFRTNHRIVEARRILGFDRN